MASEMRIKLALLLAAALAPGTIGSLAGYVLGPPLAGLPMAGFLSRRLPGGETLLEACSSDGTLLLTLADDVWSRGRLAYVSVARLDDARCKGSVGLPVARLATPLGLHIGDTAAKVNELYGASVASRSSGDSMLAQYSQGTSMNRGVLLSITTRQGIVTRISLGLQPKEQ